MSSPVLPVRNDNPLTRHDRLVGLLRALVRATGPDGPGLPLECLSPDERLRHQDAGLLIDNATGSVRLSKEVAEQAEALMLQGKRALEQAANLPRPRYDKATRTLYWRNGIVKQLEREAPDQETVLRAFEDAGWSESIPNPFFFRGEPDTLRLHDARKCLHRRLASGAIAFHVTDGGKVIWWRAA